MAILTQNQKKMTSSLKVDCLLLTPAKLRNSELSAFLGRQAEHSIPRMATLKSMAVFLCTSTFPRGEVIMRKFPARLKSGTAEEFELDVVPNSPLT